MLCSIFNDGDFRRVQSLVAFGSGIVEIDAVAGKKLRALALQGTDTAITVDGDAPCAVTHLGCHTADGHRHVAIGSHHVNRQKN